MASTLIRDAKVADKRPAFGRLLPHRPDLCGGQPGAILATATGCHQVARRGTRNVLQPQRMAKLVSQNPSSQARGPLLATRPDFGNECNLGLRERDIDPASPKPTEVSQYKDIPSIGSLWAR